MTNLLSSFFIKKKKHKDHRQDLINFYFENLSFLSAIVISFVNKIL